MNKISDLLKKSFKYYDEKNEKYKKLIEKDADFNFSKSEISIGKEKYKYELLGIFDNQSKIWIWSWLIPSIDINKSKISKGLLNYGLNLNPGNNESEVIYLKTQLVNSRFLINDEIQLEIHLALSTYLCKDNFKFIYPVKSYLDKNKTKYLTKYFLVI